MPSLQVAAPRELASVPKESVSVRVECAWPPRALWGADPNEASKALESKTL